MEVSTVLGRVSLVPRGEYDPEARYERLDIVAYGGSSYLALRDIRGVTPVDGQDYMLLVQRGQDGQDGKDGKDGETGEAGSSIASIERTSGTGAAGTADTYTITMTDGSTCDFRVYNGADGAGAGDMTKSVYDPQSKSMDIFAYVDEAVAGIEADTKALEAHKSDPTAHEELFAALEAKYRRHVAAVRERDPSKPSYGLEGGAAFAALEVEPYTGGTEVAAIVSGVEYDAKNMSANGEDVPDGTLILRKVEE